jgi:uncharacterized membrane protein YfcA
MTLTQTLVLLGSGFVAGVMNAIAGGGTIVTFPALIFTGMDAIRANTTSTVALIVGVLGSIASYRKNIPRVSHWLKLFGPISLIGGFLGGILLRYTPSKIFEALVPFLILFATVLFMAQSLFRRGLHMESREQKKPGSQWLIGAVIFQFAVSVYGGYFGAGIGILMLASLGMLGFHDIHEANTVKAVLGWGINIIAALYFIWEKLVDWPQAFAVGIGSLAGYYVGACFAQSIPQLAVRRMITGIGLALSAAMFFKQFVR